MENQARRDRHAPCRGEQPVKDVKLTVEQGIDVRKPLFSLFVTRADKDAKQQWLGWNATGPFDSSEREVERFLGWHFNTGLPGGCRAREARRSTSIDEATQEPARALVAQANLAEALEAQKGTNPPPPR